MNNSMSSIWSYIIIAVGIGISLLPFIKLNEKQAAVLSYLLLSGIVIAALTFTSTGLKELFFNLALMYFCIIFFAIPVCGDKFLSMKPWKLKILGALLGPSVVLIWFCFPGQF